MRSQRNQILFSAILFFICSCFVSFFFYELITALVSDQAVIETLKKLRVFSTAVVGFLGKLGWDVMIRERNRIKSNAESIEDLQQQVAELKDATKTLPFLQAQLANLISSRNS